MPVKIKSHRQAYGFGWALIVDGKAISMRGDAIEMSGSSIPYGAACFITIQSVRIFWRLYRERIMHNVKHNVMLSAMGQIFPKSNSEQDEESYSDYKIICQ